MNKKIGLALLLLLIIIGMAIAVLTRHKPNNIDLIMSPAAASAKLDGVKIIKPGELYVTPGKHTVTASFSGFSSTTVNFTSSETIQKVYVILQPNSQTGYDWLTNHPEDQKTREGYGGQSFSTQSNDLLKNNPIVQYLPFIGPGGAAFKIDYSYPKSGSDNVTVIVTYYTDAGKTYALNWLQGKGYPINSPNLIFVNAEAAYKSSGYSGD